MNRGAWIAPASMSTLLQAAPGLLNVVCRFYPVFVAPKAPGASCSLSAAAFCNLQVT